MKEKSLRLNDYLEHIVDAINRIDRYVAEMNELDFLSNGLVCDAVIRNFEVIGEAYRNIERDFPDFANGHPEIPFKFAYEMRNAISHGYYKVDLEQVWDSIQGDLPDLHQKIKLQIPKIN